MLPIPSESRQFERLRWYHEILAILALKRDEHYTTVGRPLPSPSYLLEPVEDGPVVCEHHEFRLGLRGSNELIHNPL